MGSSETRLIWHGVFIVFLVVYTALLAQQLGHGLASLDAHAIVKVTRELVDQHRLEVSRPPGHPTTEVYLFPSVAWLLRTFFHSEFDERTYLFCQAVAGVATVCVWYRLLCHLEVNPWKAVVASACLAVSAEFFANSVDGEEFVVAVFFLTASVYLLLRRRERPPTVKPLLRAIACFALAIGCRPEVIFAGFVIPLYAAFHPKGSWRHVLAIVIAQGLAIAVVWLPIVCIGLHWPYTAGMNFRESVLGGGYRLLFQCFTLPVFVLICWVLFQSVRQWRQRAADDFPNNFIFVVSCVTPVVFFGALFLHASKPAHVLFALPFLLILAVRRSTGLLITWISLTLIGSVVTVDIFKDRQLVGPYLVPGTYFQSIHQKPFYQLEYLKKISSQCGESPTAVIADLSPWDFEYHIAHGTFSASQETLGDNLSGFIVASAAGRGETGQLRNEFARQRLMPQCILLPRDAALHEQVITDLHSGGYSIIMDATLYRTLFARYNIAPLAITEGRIGKVAVQLFVIPNRCR